MHLPVRERTGMPKAKASFLLFTWAVTRGCGPEFGWVFPRQKALDLGWAFSFKSSNQENPSQVCPGVGALVNFRYNLVMLTAKISHHKRL